MRVLLVGGGPQESNLKHQAAVLGVSDKVTFAGRIPHADIGRYYDLVDVLVYPRHSMRLTELVTPLKPLEAMAQGRLCVASDVGGHRELIRHNETGWLFDADDVTALVESVLVALNAKAQWSAMRAAGRRFVELERNWKSSVKHYEGVYARAQEAVVRG